MFEYYSCPDYPSDTYSAYQRLCGIFNALIILPSREIERYKGQFTCNNPSQGKLFEDNIYKTKMLAILRQKLYARLATAENLIITLNYYI